MVRTEKRLGALLMTCILMLIAAPCIMAASNVMYIADDITALKGYNVTVPIMVHNATNIGCAGVNLSYNASVVNVTNATGGDFTNFFGFNNRNAANGWVTINTRITSPPDGGLWGDVVVANVTFEAVGNPNERSALNLGILALAHPNGTKVPSSAENGSFRVSMCGDVDESGIVNILDVRLLMNHVAYPDGYPVDARAGNVDGIGGIDTADVQLLLVHIFEPEANPIGCACSEE